MTRLAVFVSTVAYVGYFPIAPGTAGSAVALIVYALLVWTHSTTAYLAATLAIFAVGVWAATIAERYFGGIDPGPVVIDEVVGMLITLAFVPVSWKAALIAFVVFRVFDVIKPYPAGRLERLSGGLGVMADDAAAGLYGFAVMHLLNLWRPGWLQ
jgi:phosphatidylglycerophosphatase A